MGLAIDEDRITRWEDNGMSMVAADLTDKPCPVCPAQVGQACDRTVLGEWFAFPLPPPWSWYFGPGVSVHVHAARQPDQGSQ